LAAIIAPVNDLFEGQQRHCQQPEALVVDECLHWHTRDVANLLGVAVFPVGTALLAQPRTRLEVGRSTLQVVTGRLGSL
jgi:hypothetical protein